MFVVYRNTIDFCILTFHSKILLNSFISTRNFLVKSSGFSTQMIMASVNKESSTSYFQIFYLSYCVYRSLQDRVTEKWGEQIPVLVVGLCSGPRSAFRRSPKLEDIPFSDAWLRFLIVNGWWSSSGTFFFYVTWNDFIIFLV